MSVNPIIPQPMFNRIDDIQRDRLREAAEKKRRAEAEKHKFGSKDQPGSMRGYKPKETKGKQDKGFYGHMNPASIKRQKIVKSKGQYI